MKKFSKSLLAVSLMAAAAAASADDKVLHVYNWSDYIAEDTIAKFEKESGIKVVYDVFDSNETLEAKLLAGKSGYDIVVPSNNFLAKQIKAKVYEPLDKSKLTGWGNLNESLLKAVGDASDPGNKYAFPYMWGTIGIGYNPDKVKKALGVDKIDSWDTVLKPENLAKLKSCGVSFLDSPTEMIPVAQHYLGLPTGTEQTKAEIDKAKELFMKIRPSIEYFHSSKYIGDLANGNICVAVGYSGDVQQAKSRAKEAGGKVKVEYAIPKEGAGSFYDMVAIPKDAENKEGAYKFMNFLMQPEIMAEITNAVQFPNGNAKATELVDKAISEDKSIYPSEDVQAKLYAINGNLDPTIQRYLTRAWTQIKTGK